MELTHSVRVPAPLEEAWLAFGDPHRVGPMLPGVSVDEVTGDEFAGTCKIKLGALPCAFRGTGRYVERDAAAYRLVVETTGAERRGHGTGRARHTLVLSEVDPAQTAVEVSTELDLTGRPGQLGHGVVGDAVDRLVAQFVSRVGARVAEGLPWVPVARPAVTDARVDDVVEHPVELGATFGDVDEAEPTIPLGPSPSPVPAPRPEPRVYEYLPFSDASKPPAGVVRSVGRVLVTRVAPYAGLVTLVAYAALKAGRRRSRS